MNEIVALDPRSTRRSKTRPCRNLPKHKPVESRTLDAGAPGMRRPRARARDRSPELLTRRPFTAM